MKKALSILLVVCCIVCVTNAQIPAAAQHAYDHALRLEAKHKHEQACRTMEDAINLYPGFATMFQNIIFATLEVATYGETVTESNGNSVTDRRYVAKLTVDLLN